MPEMATQIQILCDAHGPIMVEAPDVVIDDELGDVYRVWCEKGKHGVEKRMDVKIYGLLRVAGVMTMEETIELEVGIMNRILDRGIPIDE